eukprot:4704326-Amphidinium_carterae.1
MDSTSESVRKWIVHVGCINVCAAEVPTTGQLPAQTSEMHLLTMIGDGAVQLGSQLTALEIFADDAKLAAALKSHGFDAMGLATRKLKHRLGPCSVVPLWTPDVCRELCTAIRQQQVAVAFMKPPLQIWALDL